MAVNAIVPTLELQLKEDKRGAETVVHGSSRITSTTSDLVQRTIRGLIPETSALCWTWRRSTTSTVLAWVRWSAFIWLRTELNVFWEMANLAATD